MPGIGILRREGGLIVGTVRKEAGFTSFYFSDFVFQEAKSVTICAAFSFHRFARVRALEYNYS
jgi:hypothetical protein